MQRNLRGMMQHMRAGTIHDTKYASEAHYESLWDRIRRVLQVCKTTFRCFTCRDVVVLINQRRDTSSAVLQRSSSDPPAEAARLHVVPQ
jgi:hypothetical protein